MGYNDIIGAANPFGLDIVGAQMQQMAQQGYPQGVPFYPADGLGYAQNPFALAAAQGDPNALAMLQQGGFGPLTAPLAVQQNQQPLVGLAARCPTRSQTQFVGLGSICIPGCREGILRCSPCVLMKIIKFVISSDIAYALDVVQITINGKEQLINCGPVSAVMFTEDSTIGETIATETIQPGCCVEVHFRNKSNVDVVAQIQGVARVMW